MDSMVLVERGGGKKVLVGSSCGKNIYRSNAHAKKKAKRWRGKGRLHPYTCPRCGEIHLTSR